VESLSIFIDINTTGSDLLFLSGMK
jgi:hypothetical protein